MLELVPITFAEAWKFVDDVHRHHDPPTGHKFSIAAAKDDKIVGVVMVGRPVARYINKDFTLEVNRCCTDGTKNACSFLYAAAWRAARALGYKRLITYTLKTEGGASLRAAGWKVLNETKGGPWSCRSRPRVDTHPLEPKLKWEAPDA